MRWRDFAQQNADKILLIVVLHGIMILMISDLKNPTLVDWLRGEASTPIMLITGRATKPEPAVTTTTTSTLTVVPPEAPRPVPAPAEPLAPSGIERP